MNALRPGNSGFMKESVLLPEDLVRCEAIAAKSLGKVKPFVDAVSEATGIPARAIYGTDRAASISEARQLVYYMAFRAGITVTSIGLFMHRDHATVTHGVRMEKIRRGEA